MLFCSNAVKGQMPNAQGMIRPTAYEAVLDRVFEYDKAKRDYDFVLRFEPSNAPESQICIKRTPTKTQVLEYTSLSGNIYLKLNDLMRSGGNEDVDEMAKQIQVRRRVLEVPAAQASKWLNSLPDANAATMKALKRRRDGELKGVGRIAIDGTKYSFSYNQLAVSGGAELWDYEVSDREVTGEFELVRWMNSVRRDVKELK